MKPFFIGKIENGHLKVFRPEVLRHAIAKIGEGNEFQMTVEKRSLKRSLAENAYYWGVVVKMVSDQMGILPDDAHEFMKRLFLKKGITWRGDRYEVTRSTASLSIAEFEDYCESCRNWASMEMDLVIPLPNEVEI